MNYLVKYQALLGQIEKANTIDELKDIANKAEACRMYAKKAGMDLKTQNILSEGRIRAERKAGKLLAEMDKAKGGRPTKKTGNTVLPVDRLKDIGVTKVQSQRWQQQAKVPEKEFKAHVTKITQKNEELTSVGVRQLAKGGKPGVTQNTGDNEWYTPEPYITAATAVMGKIDLDPATTAQANKVVKAKRIVTASADGLKEDWSGRIWMNPPYQSDVIGRFIEKVAKSFEDEDISEAIVLVNNATDTRWFQRLAQVATSMCFVAGRIKFIHQSGTAAAPLQGQVVVYVGRKHKKFQKEFSKYGFVVEVIK